MYHCAQTNKSALAKMLESCLGLVWFLNKTLLSTNVYQKAWFALRYELIKRKLYNNINCSIPMSPKPFNWNHRSFSFVFSKCMTKEQLNKGCYDLQNQQRTILVIQVILALGRAFVCEFMFSEKFRINWIILNAFPSAFKCLISSNPFKSANGINLFSVSYNGRALKM